MSAYRTSTPASRWFPYRQPGAAPALRLFCFPYAGGTAMVYRSWAAALPAGVEVMAVQLPGRGARLLEEPLHRIGDVVRAVVPVLLPFLDCPFAFFGYSMGALVAFETARALRAMQQALPEKLFVAACRGPQREAARNTRRHDLPLPELIAELERLNGTPREILNDPAALECFLPALRADFEVVDTYVYQAAGPLACPIQAYGGVDDDVSVEDLSAWGDHTSSGFSLEMLDGDHFFILQSAEALLERVRRALAPLTAGRDLFINA